MKRTATYTLAALAVLGLLVAMTARAPIGGREDPFPSHTFSVEFEGIAQTSFREVSGLKCETEAIEWREGNDPNTIRLLPGLSRCGPVVLTGGVTTNQELWSWYQEVLNGASPVPRKNGSIIIMDQGRTEQARYNLYNAWPSSYQFGPLDAGKTSSPLMESITIQVERLERLR